jgi:hypothetical protein
MYIHPIVLYAPHGSVPQGSDDSVYPHAKITISMWYWEKNWEKKKEEKKKKTHENICLCKPLNIYFLISAVPKWIIISRGRIVNLGFSIVNELTLLKIEKFRMIYTKIVLIS